MSFHPQSARPQILCVMRMPPDPNGHGGSQRAWHLLHGLRQVGDVHFVLLFRSMDRDCVETSLEPLNNLVRTVTRINIAGWQASERPKAGFIPGSIWDVIKMRSQEAPELSNAELRHVSSQFPDVQPDIIFAGRLCCAYILEAMIKRRQLSAPLKVVDFDDIMSKFAMRRAESSGSELKLKTKSKLRFDSLVVARAERTIADTWHAVSVCTEEDVASLREDNASRAVLKIPNVVDRAWLEPRQRGTGFNVLFTGNLGFAPNVEGLQVFVDAAWPLLKSAVPQARLTIVGLNPTESVQAIALSHGFPLFSNVPTLKPFYQEADAVIAPILFGSGTRIKILEAMAYGRPVVSTSLGAEGMGLVDGKHILLADSMSDFAKALQTLAEDTSLGSRVAQQAREFQQAHYTPAAIAKGVEQLIEVGRHKAQA